MKNLKNLKSAATLACVIFLSAIGLTSCLKDNNHYVINPTALLMVIQASPDAPSESIFLKPNQVNQSAFNYGDHLGYFNAYTGGRLVQLFGYGSSTLIASDSIHLANNNAYSLFLANTYTKPDFVLLTDSLARPASGKATIRFVNVSAGSGNVDLVANTTTLVTNEPYRGVSISTPAKAAPVFTPVSGNVQYNFEVRATGTTTVLASLDSINIRNGGVYTIWYHGSTTGTSPKLSADIIANAYY
ncbi:DUF4397 domain-containing protein [Mucilaginibacter sp. L196]|uniref:DUF4397 domain-containing protein n=1 Tax=Mucilaginibacter sp. L196 TaxID=1641870 RepID=UPI00131E51C9|nr:DUF4397 domain-containing protein [Mucilaginibacter sp. L196]